MNNYRKSYQGWRRFGHEEGCQELFSKHHRGGSRGGFGGRGEGKRRFFERGEFKFALLELLASAPMHGYQLIKAMEEKTGGLYIPSAGSVYPNLQLLEDMNLIGSIEEDGKKLYRITDEGSEYLRTSGRADAERTEMDWERRDRHRLSEKPGKHELRELMREWSEVIYVMARAAKEAQDNPASAQADKFQAIMAGFQTSLQELIASDTNGNADADEPAAKPTDDTSVSSDDSQ